MGNSKGKKEGSTIYEVCYLILPSIPEDKLDDIVGSIRGIITEESGVEVDFEAPFRHPLAYSMSKTIGASRYVTSDAYIGWIKFEVEPAKAVVIKDKLDKLEEILRFLLVKAPRNTTFTFAKAKAVAKEKEEELESASVEDSSMVKEDVVK